MLSNRRKVRVCPYCKDDGLHPLYPILFIFKDLFLYLSWAIYPSLVPTCHIHQYKPILSEKNKMKFCNTFLIEYIFGSREEYIFSKNVPVLSFTIKKYLRQVCPLFSYNFVFFYFLYLDNQMVTIINISYPAW